MKELLLSQSKVSLVDDLDYEWLSQWKWCILITKKNRYAKRCDQFGDTLLMHRVIMNAVQVVEVDHINGNGLDNQRSNLRLATSQQNKQNTKKRTIDSCSSFYKGVSWSPRSKPWRSRTYLGGKELWLGRFNTEIEAARAYNEAVVKYFGEFAVLNEIQSLVVKENKDVTIPI